LGATETVTWQYRKTTLEAVLDLKAAGYKVYAVEQANNSIALQQFDWVVSEKIAVVFGNEVEGVNNEVLTHCDGCIEIPQLGTKHSLNISVAAGIILWELVRDRI